MRKNEQIMAKIRNDLNNRFTKSFESSKKQSKPEWVRVDERKSKSEGS